MTVKDCLDADCVKSIQTPGMRSLSWFAGEEGTLSKALAACRACVRYGDDAGISDAALLNYIKDEAVGIGERYFDHRDPEQATSDSLDRVQSIIKAARENRSKWTFWFPIVRLIIPNDESSFSIGPVEFINEGLGCLVVHGHERRRLGEYGTWAVESYQLDKDEKRQFWSQHFGEIYSVAKVEGVSGDEPYAYREAREEIAKAFAILRVAHWSYGSWAGENDFVIPGEPLAVPMHFELKGSERGSVTTVLVSQVDPDNPESDFRSSHTLRTDLYTSVQLDNYLWVQRRDIVTKMAELVWSGNRWPQIVAAIRVFDESIRIGFAGAAFLGLMNSIEVLIGGDFRDWNDSITNRIAERVGFLLGENDPTLRMEVAKSFKKLYSLRSALTHSSSSVELEELFRLESIARLLIMRMTWEAEVRGFSGFKDFTDWIYQLKFGHQYEEVEFPDWLRLSPSWLD